MSKDSLRYVANLMKEDVPAASVEHVSSENQEIEVTYNMANHQWGMGTAMAQFMADNELVIRDFSHVDMHSIKLYIEQR